MPIPAFLKTIATASYYRKNRFDALREVATALQFKRHRIYDPVEFLANLGIDEKAAFDGYPKWRVQLEEVVHRVQASPGHQGGCSIEDGLILYGLARALKPKVVIETGVAAGVSTSFLSAALIENGTGRLYSLELPPAESSSRRHDDGGVFDWPEQGVGWAIPREIRQGMAGRHDLVLEDVRTSLPRLMAQLPEIGLYFHDDLHTPDHMRWQYELVWPRIVPGGVLVSDDSNIGWVDFCATHGLGRGAYVNLQRLTAVRKPVGPTALAAD